MADPRELLDQYAASEYDIILESEYAVPPVTGSVPRTAVAPAAFDALRAVLDIADTRARSHPSTHPLAAALRNAVAAPLQEEVTDA